MNKFYNFVQKCANEHQNFSMMEYHYMDYQGEITQIAKNQKEINMNGLIDFQKKIF